MACTWLKNNHSKRKENCLSVVTGCLFGVMVIVWEYNDHTGRDDAHSQTSPVPTCSSKTFVHFNIAQVKYSLLKRLRLAEWAKWNLRTNLISNWDQRLCNYSLIPLIPSLPHNGKQGRHLDEFDCAEFIWIYCLFYFVRFSKHSLCCSYFKSI